MKKSEAYRLADKNLGICGRMMSGSKSDYCDRHPENLTLFNCNVCTRKLGKLWYGDRDLSFDEQKLIDLAAQLGEDVYVLREMDARFNNEEKPLFDQFVLKVSVDGSVELGRDHQKYFARVDGKLKRVKEY